MIRQVLWPVFLSLRSNLRAAILIGGLLSVFTPAGLAGAQSVEQDPDTLIMQIEGLLRQIDTRVVAMSAAIDQMDQKLIDLEDQMAETDDANLQAKLSEMIDRLTVSLDSMEAERDKILDLRETTGVQLDALKAKKDGQTQ